MKNVKKMNVEKKLNKNIFEQNDIEFYDLISFFYETISIFIIIIFIYRLF